MKLYTKTAPVNHFAEVLNIYNYINHNKPTYYPVLKLIQQASYVHNGFNNPMMMNDLRVAYSHMYPNETAVLVGNRVAFLFTKKTVEEDFANLGFLQPQEKGYHFGGCVVAHGKYIFLRCWRESPNLGGCVEIYERVGNSVNYVQTLKSELEEAYSDVASSISVCLDRLAITGMEEAVGQSVTIYRYKEGTYYKQAVIPMNSYPAKLVHLFDDGKGLMVVEDDDTIYFYTRKDEQWTLRMSTTERYIAPKKYNLELTVN